MTVLTYLESLAGDALHLPGEKRKVQDALAKLQRRLSNHFSDQLESHFKFGSSARGTNLPRAYAEEMDIDYLVVFSDRTLAPKTLIRKLVEFARQAYPRNTVFQSSPAVVIEMRDVTFELVPARKTLTGLFHSHEIPNGNATVWVGTNPRGFEEVLVNRNKECHNRLKAAIRLAKMWNVANGYVFSSYQLENFAVNTSYLWDSNLTQYFRRLLMELPERELDAAWRVEKLRRGKRLLTDALRLDANGDVAKAEELLNQLFGVY
jgi:hypothetical protein